MRELRIRELRDEEIKSIVTGDFIGDFPAPERKPLEMIFALKKADNYLCLGLFDDDEIRGYAYLVKVKDCKNLLLDYFAILKPYRSGGYGSRFLGLLKKSLGEYQGMILEVESPNHAVDEEELTHRNRRLDFYYANGLKSTNIETSVNGVVYTILHFPFEGELGDEEILGEINAIYPVLYCGEYYNKWHDYTRLIGK